MDEQLLVYRFHCVEVSRTVLLWRCLLPLTNVSSDQLPYFIITAIHLPVVGSYSCITVLSIFIYAVTCAWSLLYAHMCQMLIYNCCCFVIPASKWQFECLLLWLLAFYVTCLHYVLAPRWLQQSLSNLCTVTCNNTCLPQTHTTRLYWALPYKCLRKVCHVHVVLSTLYQEKMLKEREMEELNPAEIAQIQCTKPPVCVVKRTAEPEPAEVDYDEEGKCVLGQWVYCVSLLFICWYVVSTMNKKDWYNFTVALSIRLLFYLDITSVFI